MKHPLDHIGLQIKQFKCFGEEGAECGNIHPINILIGRNNSGKSAIIDALELCTSKGSIYDFEKHNHQGNQLRISIKQLLDEMSLRKVFNENTSGGGIHYSNHWAYGQRFVDHCVVRNFGKDFKPSAEHLPTFNEISEDNRKSYENELIKVIPWPFADLSLLKISAERDVQPEKSDNDNIQVQSNGVGTTNLVRAFINRSSLPREEIEEKLLSDLNNIYLGDSKFNNIICQEDEDGLWEIYLSEKDKGNIRLSQSGSSLKSIFIILSFLRLVPFTEEITHDKIIFVIEEPENNLHPSLLRRLLDFLADQRDEHQFTLFITTHSASTIDWATRRNDSQIIHVRSDGKESKADIALEYYQHCDILDDLDIRASDILQSNGIIWVEGPSDRIYVRHWLNLFSDGKLKEGVHYTIMFYGGKLLSHLHGLSPDERDEQISLLKINRNAAIIIDSDRKKTTSTDRTPPRDINETKRRIEGEFSKFNGFVWITKGKEIENYTPEKTLEEISGQQAQEKIGIYDDIVKLTMMSDFKKNKVKIAHSVTEKLKKEDIVDYLDLWENLKELSKHIGKWNGEGTLA